MAGFDLPRVTLLPVKVPALAGSGMSAFWHGKGKADVPLGRRFGGRRKDFRSLVTDCSVC